MIRPIYTHCVNGSTLELSLCALDERSPIHGSNHDYRVSWGELGLSQLNVRFQKDPIQEVGVNGVSIEALLAICADRLEGFQTGKFPCDENAQALTNINKALAVLKSRTARRIARGVEGQRKL